LFVKVHLLLTQLSFTCVVLIISGNTVVSSSVLILNENAWLHQFAFYFHWFQKGIFVCRCFNISCYITINRPNPINRQPRFYRDRY
jgi:hypothetical protein